MSGWGKEKKRKAIVRTVKGNISHTKHNVTHAFYVGGEDSPRRLMKEMKPCHLLHVSTHSTTDTVQAEIFTNKPH